MYQQGFEDQVGCNLQPSVSSSYSNMYKGKRKKKEGRGKLFEFAFLWQGMKRAHDFRPEEGAVVEWMGAVVEGCPGEIGQI